MALAAILGLILWQYRRRSRLSPAKSYDPDSPFMKVRPFAGCNQQCSLPSNPVTGSFKPVTEIRVACPFLQGLTDDELAAWGSGSNHRRLYTVDSDILAPARSGKSGTTVCPSFTCIL